MKQAELEIRHRGIIDELNAKRKLSLTYYRDAYVEDDVRPLVEVLNNPWTVSAYSCGGHWERDGKGPYFPYVSFYVMPGKRAEWGAIWRKTKKSICQHLDDKVTLEVSETFSLPDRLHGWVGWYFYPPNGRRTAKDVFRDTCDFREAHDRVIGEMCHLLRGAMEDRQVGCIAGVGGKGSGLPVEADTNEVSAGSRM
jgi:hypothetical protein